jgi:tetratricopeptide (TPR) repeat protein
VQDRQRSDGYQRYFSEQLGSAREAFDCSAHKQALTLLNGIIDFSPTMAMNSREALKLLLDLGRFDEAEMMMQNGLRRYPSRPHFACGSAQTAHRRGDLEEALRRCEVARRKFPHASDGYTIATACLADLGRDHEAEAMIAQAVRKLPRDFDAVVAYARYAVRRQDWEEALRRWQLVKRRFNHFLGPVGIAQSLREMGRYDEAEEMAAEACRHYSTDTWPFVEFAAVASAKGDFDMATARWKDIRLAFPFFSLAFTAGAEAARRAGRDAEADAILELAVYRLRSDLSVHLEYARNAHRRGHWPAAVERWASTREQFPDCVEAREQEANARMRQSEATGIIGSDLPVVSDQGCHT